jgi:SAM-dependent methyltransferase
MTPCKVNLACGSVYVSGDGWVNLDYASFSRDVSQANLLGRLPLPDNSAELVYSSHFLEHIPRDLVKHFLGECLRLLKPGGVLRLAVPDLENLCRSYLSHRDRGEHAQADFVVIELLDQCVRRDPGGELLRYFQALKLHPLGQREKISFVQERIGQDGMNDAQPLNLGKKARLVSLLRRAPAKVERLWISAVLRLLPKAFRAQNVSLASIGERHHWLYDAYQLQHLLVAAGFESIKQCTASSSRFTGFPFHPLDVDADGRPRKGLETLFIEAQKPR